MKRMIVLIGILCATLAGIFVLSTFLSLNKTLSALKKENTDLKQALVQDKTYIATLQQQSQDQLKQKIDALDKLRTQQINQGLKISISSRDRIESERTHVVAFWVNGVHDAVFDAMDLGLSLSNIVGIPDCTVGTVFNTYPSIDGKEGSLRITGVANISGDSIATGVINREFATCVFSKKDPSQQAVLKLDTQNTHIYSLGKSVLDLDGSFKDIIW